ncbi:MAG: hypothetical protein KU37_05845 [Sulfuricurvum sp. PC08-66]|nr:MAG: hypothetical protein KU37_05845 [Sulfuricurvum sp. PC08-66]
MIFGKIDYLNLLPFNVFIKRHVRSTRMHATIAYKKGVPSAINAAFNKRKVNAAFISSIESKGRSCVDAGIVAHGIVESVIVIEGQNGTDSESATSNALAKKLGLEGQVLIGDKALRYVLSGAPYIDMATRWHEKHQLPFVFARLCYHKKGCLVEKLAREFLRKRPKIPYYLMQKASQESGISADNIQKYLQKIHYAIGDREKKSLKKFLG